MFHLKIISFIPPSSYRLFSSIVSCSRSSITTHFIMLRLLFPPVAGDKKVCNGDCYLGKVLLYNNPELSRALSKLEKSKLIMNTNHYINIASSVHSVFSSFTEQCIGSNPRPPTKFEVTALHYRAHNCFHLASSCTFIRLNGRGKISLHFIIITRYV